MKEKAEKIEVRSITTEEIKSLKAAGIPISKVWFRETVRNENHLADPRHPGIKETKPDRLAEMTLTPMGMLIEQKGKRPCIVPSANVKWCDL